MSRTQLRERLVAARAETVDRIAALVAEVADIDASTAGVATDDEHDPEGATIAFERARVSALLDASRGRMTEIDRAVRRLDAADPSYGTCEICGAPIGAERIIARPTATRCVGCAH